MGIGLVFWKMKMLYNYLVVIVHNPLNILELTDFYSFAREFYGL